LSRLEQGRYQATNSRGGTISIGTGQNADFTPVELLLTAIAGCSAVDVDYITGKRAEPTNFDVVASGDKISDDHGNHMADVGLDFDVAFGADDAAERARAVLDRSIKQSHDRLCTVSRTVELATPVTVRRSGQPI
jgi:uncharacterized OsmC-like protein